MLNASAQRVSSHLWPEISAQLLCCTPTAHWLVDWNEDAVRRFAA